MVSLDHMSAPGIPGRVWVYKRTVVQQARAAAPSEAAGNAGSADIAAGDWGPAIERQQRGPKV